MGSLCDKEEQGKDYKILNNVGDEKIIPETELKEIKNVISPGYNDNVFKKEIKPINKTNQFNIFTKDKLKIEHINFVHIKKKYN